MKKTTTNIGFETRFNKYNDLMECFNFIVSKYSNYNMIVSDCLIYPRKFQIKTPFVYEKTIACEMSTKKAIFEAIKLEVYSTSDSLTIIRNYEDYKNGFCNALLLIYDMLSMEIYCKKQDELNELMLFTLKHKLEYFDIKSEKSDQRTSMFF